MSRPTNVAGRTRRALVDITNNAPAPNLNNKRPALQSTASISDIVLTEDPVTARGQVYQDTVTTRTRGNRHQRENEPRNEENDRSYMNREVDDIDGRDGNNPLLCCTYVNDMYEFFGNVEREMMVNPSYMTSQASINDKMRCILVDWLVEVHLKFKMVPETLYLTVNLIDRYLELVQVRRSHLQRVGVAALLLAAKYEEIYPPELHDLVFITDRAYTQKEILETESHIAVTLKYNLTVPTTHTFLCRYLKAAHADRTMVQIACYLAERTLQEYSMMKFLPSTIAAAAVRAARISTHRHPWSPTLLEFTGYDEDDIAACASEMNMFFEINNPPQNAVIRKYSSSKFGGVAKLPISI